MVGLVPAPSTLPARITGSSWVWGRDLGVVSGATALAAATHAFGIGGYALVLSALGVMGGLLLGLEMPRFLDTARQRMSLPAIAVRCTAAGGAMGGMVALLTLLVGGAPLIEPVIVATVAGALQLGWFWLPYTVLTVLQRPTWPVVVGAVVLAPLAGPAAMGLLQLLLWVCL